MSASSRTRRSSRLARHPYIGVLRNVHLRRLYLGIFVSSLGDGIAVVTFPWLALEVAGNVNRTFAVAAAATLAFLPGIPVSLITGPGRWRIPGWTMLSVGLTLAVGAVALAAVLCPRQSNEQPSP